MEEDATGRDACKYHFTSLAYIIIAITGYVVLYHGMEGNVYTFNPVVNGILFATIASFTFVFILSVISYLFVWVLITPVVVKNVIFPSDPKLQ